MLISASIIFAFGAMLFWGIGDFLIQKTVRKIGEFETLIWINLIGGLGLLPFVIKDFKLITSWENLLALIILGIIDFFFGITLLKAYEDGKLSVVEIIMTIELPFTVLLGVFFLKEQLSFLQVILILIIFSGIFFISKSPKDLFEKLKNFFIGRHNLLEKGAKLAMVAAVISAFYNFMVAVNSRGVSAIMAIWFPWVLSFFFLLLYVGRKKGFKNLLAKSAEWKKTILVTGIIDTAAWVCFAFALSKQELSVTTAITESYPVIAMFLGIKYNQEKISGYQYCGALLALAGSVAIGLIS